MFTFNKSNRKKKMTTKTADEKETQSNNEGLVNENETSEMEIENSTADEAMAESDSMIDLAKKVQVELETMKDKYLRLNAEFDNYKRRTMKERIDLLKSANADVITALLPVVDDLER